MSDLYPTPTRLALLADVADGHVWANPMHIGGSYILYPDGNDSTVTARIAELMRARWVELGPPEAAEGQLHDECRWRLTDAGRAVLDQHRRADT